MDWQTDPYLRRIEMERTARNAVLRSAIIWTPFFVVALAALCWAVVDRLFIGDGSTWFLVVVLSVLTFLFGYQSIQAIRDLVGGSRTIEGEVKRKWSRTDSLVLRSHYIRLHTKQIIRIDDVFHGDVKVGHWVSVRYYPHSAMAIECESIDDPRDTEDTDEDEQPAATVTDLDRQLGR